MVMSSVSPRSMEESALLQPVETSVVEPLMRQVVLEQPQFQAGAPLTSVWKARTSTHQSASTAAETSSSGSSSGNNNNNKEKIQQSLSSSSEEITEPVSKPLEDLETASTSSSSHPRTPLSEEEDEEGEDALETTNTNKAETYHPSMRMMAPVNPEEMEERTNANIINPEDENISQQLTDSAQVLNQGHAALTPQEPTPPQQDLFLPEDYEEEGHAELRPHEPPQQPQHNFCISEEDEEEGCNPLTPQETQSQQNLCELEEDEKVAPASSGDVIDDNQGSTSEPPKSPEKRLDWSFLRCGVLYDRDDEIEALQSAFRRQFDGDYEEDEEVLPSLVVVSGLSGTGKSALTKAALEPLVRERNGFYLTGKFDQLQHAEPYAPFVNAMNDYVYYVLQQQQCQNQYEHISSLSFLETLQTEILSALSPEGCSILLQMIPSLSHILHIDKDSSFSNFHHHAAAHQRAGAAGLASSFSTHPSNNNAASLWEASQDRVKVIFRRFLRVICKPERPCCLVLDDLQWSDTASLDLMESLICDVENNKGLFLVGICRSNEISVDHNLANLLRRLEDNHNAQIQNVIARNLTFDATNQLICDVLKQSWEICVPLTEIIHAQTKGNVFYVMNYIKALYADSVLIPDEEYGTGGWLWDEERWQQLFNPPKKRPQYKGQNSDDSPQELSPSVAHDNDHDLSPVVDLIARQLRRLPEPTQLVLRTCACIGAEIDMALVEKVLIEMDILSSMQLAVDEGLLVVMDRPNDGRHYEPRSLRNDEPQEEEEEANASPVARRFMFAHDGIQQAAYSLIPESKKSASHLSVGRMLFKNMMSMEEFNDNVFVVVNQMNRGMSHIDDQSERDGLAALNLKAGNRAILSSDFHTAVQYFIIGTTLLAQSPHHWARQYELSLELYNSLAEAEYCVADFDMMDVAVLEVLQNGLDFRDMIRAYATQVYALGARFMLQEAIDLGLQVLERFDETFADPRPKRNCCMRALSAPMKTKRKLGWKTKSQLLYMPDMNDPDKLASMGILNLLTTYSLIGRPSLFPFIAARLVKLSLDHGLCAISAPGFAFYGLWLCSIGDPQAGYRYGTLALDILERYQNTITEWVPRVYSVFYGWIAPWKQPLRSTFPHTLHAHRVGLETGDIEYSCIGAHVYSMNAFFAGMPLPELESSMRKFVDLMNKHKQGPWAAATSVQLQLIHNLMGKSEDPLILRGEIMTDEKVMEIATVQNMESYETYFVQVMVWSLLLAYHFGKLRHALATANDCREAVKDLGPSFLLCLQYFYDGMTSIAAAADPKFERNKKQHVKVAARALKKLQKVAKHCPENCLHKVYLLQAEFATVRGDLDNAIVLYNKSITAAHDNGFLQDEALAHERAGIALWHASNDPKANMYLSRALDFYSLWGAEAKVEDLRCQYFQ